MRRYLFKQLAALAKRMTGGEGGQLFLGWLAMAAQYLQGIGAGTDIASSGERTVFEQLLWRSHWGERISIFDVGANRGQFLHLARCSLEGRDFTVHCFEPARRTFELLRESAARLPDTILNNCGLGREPGEFDLYYDAAGSGLASLTKRELAHFGVEMAHSEKVRIATLDAYCAGHGIERIDLLKIDVEGHELDVLHGARRMFAQSAIGMVLFEFGGCNIDTRTFFQDFYRFFAERNMHISRITPAGTLFELETYSEALEQFRTSNFVAIRQASDRSSCAASKTPWWLNELPVPRTAGARR